MGRRQFDAGVNGLNMHIKHIFIHEVLIRHLEKEKEPLKWAINYHALLFKEKLTDSQLGHN